MREFMLYIRNDGSELPQKSEEEFLRACEVYIEDLQRRGQLISAQPLGREGAIISTSSAGWSQGPYGEGSAINAGYYHLRAANLDEAIAIAKQNPEFKYRPKASIEVRAIKTDEDTTGYVYPSGEPRQ